MKYQFKIAVPCLIFIITMLSTTPSFSCNESTEICASNSEWAKQNISSFTINDKNSSSSYDYVIEITENRDAKVHFLTKNKNGEFEGTILLISGRAMLTDGFKMEEGYEIDYIDRPVLMNQLVISLLQQAFPNGPRATVSTKNVHLTENDRAIKVATMSASGRFGPSWDLKAQITQISEYKFSYSMTFIFDIPRTKAKSIHYEIAGIWESNPQFPKIEDSLSTNQLDIYWLNSRHPQAKSPKPATIGELRRILKKY